MTAILSFLGSAVFRWILEKGFSIFERKQDHAQELELRRLQEQIDSASHERNLSLLERQAALQLELKEADHRGAIDMREYDALTESIKSAQPTGIRWIDGWNSAVRPFVATVCVLMWLAILASNGFKPAEFDQAIIGSVLGWYFGTRSLLPGKK
jgi:hypothetical protein